MEDPIAYWPFTKEQLAQAPKLNLEHPQNIVARQLPAKWKYIACVKSFTKNQTNKQSFIMVLLQT